MSLRDTVSVLRGEGVLTSELWGILLSVTRIRTPQVGFPVENLELAGALLPEIMVHVGPF